MLLQTEHISLADDNTSVNGDDVYEDDWEEELEKDDSEEESGSRDDEEEAEPSENVSHVSGNGYNCIYLLVYSIYLHHPTISRATQASTH
jgi:hypothetical protein